MSNRAVNIPDRGNHLTRIHGPQAASPGSDSVLPPSHDPHHPTPMSTPETLYPHPQSYQHSSNPSSLQTPNPSLKRSRARSTKSCERCREKKLKCDRELPCSNCKKGGRDGSECTFAYGPGLSDSNAAEEAHQMGMKKFRVEKPEDPHAWDRLQAPRSTPIPGPELTDTRGKDSREALKSRLMPSVSGFTSRDNFSERHNQQSPAYVTPCAAMQTPVSTPSLVQGSTDVIAAPLGRIAAKGAKSRFTGAGNKMEIMDHFMDSKDFIMGSFRNPEVAGMVQEMTDFQTSCHPRSQHKLGLADDPAILQQTMLDALPSGFLFGILQARYISNWETIVRVLHVSTFMREVDEIAAIKDTPKPIFPPHIRESLLPQILAVVAIASRLNDPNDRHSTAEIVTDEQNCRNIAMVQKWVDGLRGRSLLNFDTLQTRLLLFMAHQAYLAHPLELWNESGALVRFAMGMGLHKDPEDIDVMSKISKEMRRKVWMTIVELDVQVSIPVGLPSSVVYPGYNLAELVNVDDREMTENMIDYPESKPQTIWTNALPQIALGASINERLLVTNLLGGNVNLERDTPLFLHHTKILEKALQSLPSQFRASTKAGNTSNKRLYRLFTSIMVDMSIRRPLLALYRTIALSPYSKLYPEARKGALRSSLAILAHLDALDPAVADLNIVKTRDYLNLFQVWCKYDINIAALMVCYEIQAFNTLSCSSEENMLSPEPFEQMPEDPFPHTKHSLTRVAENTLSSLIQRLGEFGSDLKDILPLSIVLQSIRSDGTPEEKRQLMVRGAERILSACRVVMPSIKGIVPQNNYAQNDNIPQHPGPLPSLPQSWQTSTPQTYNQNSIRMATVDMNMLPGNSEFDMFDFGFTGWDVSPSWL